jgi:hypothetical protein
MQQLLKQSNSKLRHQGEAFYLALILLGSYQPSDSIGTRGWAEEFRTAASLQFRHAIRFLTQKGYIGQARPVVRVGDKVIIIQGCEVPYVFRPLGGRQYSLISDCYVHGVMYGEAWDQRKAQDIEIL